jgi:hypothetical protein
MLVYSNDPKTAFTGGRRIVRRIAVTAIVLAFRVAPQLGAQDSIQSACNAILDKGISNNYELLTEDVQYSLLKTRFCDAHLSTYDELDSLSTKFGIPLPVADNILNLQGSLDAKRNTFSKNYSSFCSSQYSESYYRSFTQERKSEVSKVLTSSWNACINTMAALYLDQKGILIGVMPFDAMRQFKVELRVKAIAGAKPKIVQVAPAGVVKCELNPGTPITPNFPMPLTEIQLTCKKDATLAVPFSITVDPGGIAKTIVVPAESDRVVELIQKIVDLENRLQTVSKAVQSVKDEMPTKISLAPGSVRVTDVIRPTEKGFCAEGEAQVGIEYGMGGRDIRAICAKIQLKH